MDWLDTLKFAGSIFGLVAALLAFLANIIVFKGGLGTYLLIIGLFGVSAFTLLTQLGVF